MSVLLLWVNRPRVGQVVLVQLVNAVVEEDIPRNASLHLYDRLADARLLWGMVLMHGIVSPSATRKGVRTALVARGGGTRVSTRKGARVRTWVGARMLTRMLTRVSASSSVSKVASSCVSHRRVIRVIAVRHSPPRDVNLLIARQTGLFFVTVGVIELVLNRLTKERVSSAKGG